MKKDEEFMNRAYASLGKHETIEGIELVSEDKPILTEKDEIRKKALKWIHDNGESTDDNTIQDLKQAKKYYRKPLVNPNGIVIDGIHRFWANEDCDFDIEYVSDEEALKRRREMTLAHKSDEIRKAQLKKGFLDSWNYYQSLWKKDNSVINQWKTELGLDREHLSQGDIIRRLLRRDYRVSQKTLERYLPKELLRPHKFKTDKLSVSKHKEMMRTRKKALRYVNELPLGTRIQTLAEEYKKAENELKGLPENKFNEITEGLGVQNVDLPELEHKPEDKPEPKKELEMPKEKPLEPMKRVPIGDNDVVKCPKCQTTFKVAKRFECEHPPDHISYENGKAKCGMCFEYV